METSKLFEEFVELWILCDDRKEDTRIKHYFHTHTHSNQILLGEGGAWAECERKCTLSVQTFFFYHILTQVY